MTKLPFDILANVDSFLTVKDRTNVAQVNKELRTVFNPGLQITMQFSLIFAWTFTSDGSSTFVRGDKINISTTSLDGKLSYDEYDEVLVKHDKPDARLWPNSPSFRPSIYSVTQKLISILRGYVDSEVVGLFVHRVIMFEGLYYIILYSDVWRDKNILTTTSIERTHKSLNTINTTSSQKPFIVDILDYRSNYLDEVSWMKWSESNYTGPLSEKREFGSQIDVKFLVSKVSTYNSPAAKINEESQEKLVNAIREVGLLTIKPLFDFSAKFQVRVEKFANSNRDQFVRQ